jgi:hypothetical protein
MPTVKYLGKAAWDESSWFFVNMIKYVGVLVRIYPLRVLKRGRESRELHGGCWENHLSDTIYPPAIKKGHL